MQPGPLILIQPGPLILIQPGPPIFIQLGPLIFIQPGATYTYSARWLPDLLIYSGVFWAAFFGLGRLQGGSDSFRGAFLRSEGPDTPGTAFVVFRQCCFRPSLIFR